jgi:demethylmenaquinone methyltransferase/2-methoxy-6-polyprenyl-1,4-benzoquinol methylase
MFDVIAHSYDRANNVLSLGIHHLWRRKLVRWSGAESGVRVLDCATGTGDLAIEFKKVVGPEGSVVGSDFSSQMISMAPAKAQRAGLEIVFEQADVTQLPYAEKSFDVSSISFGIRNVQNRELALRELARVTRPQGRVMILEFGQPKLWGLRHLYAFYSQMILPRIGGWISGKADAYRYLQESSEEFPCGAEFGRFMEETGKFSKVEYRALSFGIAYIYRAEVR